MTVVKLYLQIETHQCTYTLITVEHIAEMLTSIC